MNDMTNNAAAAIERLSQDMADTPNWELEEKASAWIREVDRIRATLTQPDALTSQPSGEAVGSTRGYFIYDGNQFDEVKSLQEAHRQAEEALSYFRDDAPDGWPDGVENICYGVILGRSIKTVERPAEPTDNMEADIAVYADYEITHPSALAPGVAVDELIEADKRVREVLTTWESEVANFVGQSIAKTMMALAAKEIRAALAPKPEGGHG